MRRWLAIALALALAAGCGDEVQIERDLGPLDDVLDDLTKIVWPGVVDTDGNRHVRRINGFFDGVPTAYWFSGFAPRFTAEVFWFCREADATCPLRGDGTVNAPALLGRPVFSRIPGEAGYSPYWSVKVVRVGSDYRPDDIKSVLGIEAALADKRARLEPVTVVAPEGGSEAAIVHCLLVLEDTELEHNGADAIGQPGVPTHRLPRLRGWHKRYRVSFFDFTAIEGVFAADPASTDVPRMPAANIYVMFRDCQGGATSALCDASSSGEPSVSERGVELDLTGDGDKSDTNNIIAAIPGTSPRDPVDKPYSALWAVNVVRVPPNRDAQVSLIDTTGDQATSDITSVAAMRTAIAEGLLEEPVPMSEMQAGNSIAGNDGEVFFNCPSQVPIP